MGKYTQLEREEKVSIQVEEDGSAPCASQKMGQISYLGVALCVLFIAQSLAQNLFTTLYPSIAFQGWAIIMFVLGVVSLFTPFIQKKLGIRISLFLGALCHLIYIASLITGVTWMILAGCAILGFGGALLWVTHGVYMTVVCDGEDVGKLNGLFWLIFNTNLIVGTVGLSSLYFLGIEVDLSQIPFYMTFVALLGSIMILFAKYPKEKVEEKVGFWASLKEEGKRTKDTLLLTFDSRMILLLSTYLLQGTTASFVYGLMPLLVEPSNVSNMFLVFGVCKTLASYGSGYFYDRCGWQFLIVATLITNFVGYSLAALGFFTGNFYYIFVCAGMMGALEAIFLILISGTIMSLWPEDSAPPFACYRFLNALGSGTGYLVSPLVSWFVLAIFNCILAIIAAVAYFVLYYVVLKKDKNNYAKCEEQKQNQFEMGDVVPGDS